MQTTKSEINISNKNVLYLFRNDLRIHDNEALYLSQFAKTFLPIYIIDEKEDELNQFGFSRISKQRKKIRAHSLLELKSKLNKLGSDLFIFNGNVSNIIKDLIITNDTNLLLYQNIEAEEELRHIDDVKKYTSIEICIVNCKSLIVNEDLPFNISNLPSMFTAFRKIVEKNLVVRDTFQHYTQMAQLPTEHIKIHTQIYNIYEDIEEIEIDRRTSVFIKGGEQEGLNRLNYYLFESKKISNYKQTRNELLGPDYSSKFSSYLSYGSLSPRFIYHEIKKYESINGANESTYWLVFELLWRDYFIFLSKKFGNKIFQLHGLDNKYPYENISKEIFLKWSEFNTGNDFIDANMKELYLTGYMSNRGRQNVASYWCKDLKQDWRVGASWFEYLLIDYDVHINWCNWQYIAGIGVDPRADRYFNTAKQAATYDPNNTYRKHWLQ